MGSRLGEVRGGARRDLKGVSMKLVLAVMAVGAMGAAVFSESGSEPAAWAIVLAGVAGSGFVGRRRTKKAIDTDD